MPDEVRDTAEAVKGIVEAVPVYQDVVQPAAREIGKALQTLAKTVHIVLAPIAALVWGYEQISDYLEASLTEKLKRVPPEELVTPSPTVAGPAVEALRFAGHDETLRDMFANLLATAMDARTARDAHPAFVEILKQLTPDEALLLGYISRAEQLPLVNVRARVLEGTGSRGNWDHLSLFAEKAGLTHAELTPSYITNLARLGVLDLPEAFYTSDEVYAELESHADLLRIRGEIDAMEGFVSEIDRRLARVTSFGQQFIGACVVDQTETRRATTLDAAEPLEP